MLGILRQMSDKYFIDDSDFDGLEQIWSSYYSKMWGILLENTMKDNCSNCLFSRVRRFEAWCELDKEIKYMHHVCNKYKRGTQAEMIRKDGTVTWHLLPLWEQQFK